MREGEVTRVRAASQILEDKSSLHHRHTNSIVAETELYTMMHTECFRDFPLLLTPPPPSWLHFIRAAATGLLKGLPMLLFLQGTHLLTCRTEVKCFGRGCGLRVGWCAAPSWKVHVDESRDVERGECGTSDPNATLSYFDLLFRNGLFQPIITLH